MFKCGLKKKKNFFDFGLKKELLYVIKENKYKNPTNIQINCIPEILNGNDVLGIAKTGSGKTASFILPILNKINLSINKIQVLVLVPTRELVIQVTNSFKDFSKYIKNIKILSVYGGQKYIFQINLLKKCVHIIIATPGRLLDYLRKKIINFSYLKFLVLDEADEMLRRGFINDVKKIFNSINISKIQICLFSATIPFQIKKIIFSFMKCPKEINLLKNKKNVIPLNIKQYYCFVFFNKKIDLLIKFLEIETFSSVIIFVRTKSISMILSSILDKKGYSCSPLNGDINQKLRERIIDKVRLSKLKILVATDIASRGLDLKNIDLIINYDVPLDIDSYIHRVGRTGRAGKIGKAILFLDKKQKHFLFLLRKKLNINIIEIKEPKDKILINKSLVKFLDLISYNKEKYNIDCYKKFFINILKEIKNKLNIKDEQIIIYLLIIIYKNLYNYIFNIINKKTIKNFFCFKIIFLNKNIKKLSNNLFFLIKDSISKYFNINIKNILFYKEGRNNFVKIYNSKINKNLNKFKLFISNDYFLFIKKK